jgi:hypothetical protein
MMAGPGISLCHWQKHGRITGVVVSAGRRGHTPLLMTAMQNEAGPGSGVVR